MGRHRAGARGAPLWDTRFGVGVLGELWGARVCWGLGPGAGLSDPRGPLPAREVSWFGLGRRRGRSEHEVSPRTGTFWGLFALSPARERCRGSLRATLQQGPARAFVLPGAGRAGSGQGRGGLFVTAVCLKHQPGNKTPEDIFLSRPSAGISFFTPCGLGKKLASFWSSQSCREGSELSTLIPILTPRNTRTATSAWKCSSVCCRGSRKWITLLEAVQGVPM